MNDEMISLIAFVLKVDIRKEIMEYFPGKYATSVAISRVVKIGTESAHYHLKELEKKGLIFCINKSDKRDKIYALTETGIEVCENLNEYANQFVFK